jgi:hypothetical protein
MDFNQKIPAYITDKKNIVRLIIFTAAFALIFINLYSPFGVNNRIIKAAEQFNLENLDMLLFISSSMIILTGVLVVVVSRVILYHLTRRRGPVTLAQYLVWLGVEVFSMALFYALYERIILDDQRSFMISFKISVQNTALVLLLPYSAMWLYFSWSDKNKQLERLREAGDGPAESKDMIVFHDEKGTMRLSLKLNDLLYLQAADNYVTIAYTNQGRIAKYMLRSSLKLIEAEHARLPLVRCHRSHMVNFEKVKLIRREKDGLKIELDADPAIEIAVSRTYIEDVFKAFGHHVET